VSYSRNWVIETHLDLDIIPGVPGIRIGPHPIIRNLDRQETNHMIVDQPPLPQRRPPLVNVLARTRVAACSSKGGSVFNRPSGSVSNRR